MELDQAWQAQSYGEKSQQYAEEEGDLEWQLNASILVAQAQGKGSESPILPVSPRVKPSWGMWMGDPRAEPAVCVHVLALIKNEDKSLQFCLFVCLLLYLLVLIN